jgi:hypothetical protein
MHHLLASLYIYLDHPAFWAQGKLDSNGCLNWTGTITSQGYGVISRRLHLKPGYKEHIYKTTKPILVHRVSIMIASGELINSDKPFVLHGCDNRRCYNPDHLRVGTWRDNSQDMVDRDRFASYKEKMALKRAERLKALH